MEYHFSTRTGIVILIEAWNETIFFKKYVWVVFFGRFFFIFTAYTYSNIKFNNPNCILNICYFSHNEFQINHKNSWYLSYWCVSTMNLFSKCIDFESKLVFFCTCNFEFNTTYILYHYVIYLYVQYIPKWISAYTDVVYIFVCTLLWIPFIYLSCHVFI